jgi:hypothetical protein
MDQQQQKQQQQPAEGGAAPQQPLGGLGAADLAFVRDTLDRAVQRVLLRQVRLFVWAAAKAFDRPHADDRRSPGAHGRQEAPGLCKEQLLAFCVGHRSGWLVWAAACATRTRRVTLRVASILWEASIHPTN